MLYFHLAPTQSNVLAHTCNVPPNLNTSARSLSCPDLKSEPRSHNMHAGVQNTLIRILMHKLHRNPPEKAECGEFRPKNIYCTMTETW